MTDAPPTYKASAWFRLLLEVDEQMQRREIAQRLGLSPAAVGQVLNGSGAYGDGRASTARIAQRVLAAWGTWPCPHLTDHSADGQPVTVTAARCGELAHRPVPTGSPRDVAHWQACRRCQHYATTAPATLAPAQAPRKPAATPNPAAPHS